MGAGDFKGYGVNYVSCNYRLIIIIGGING